MEKIGTIIKLPKFKPHGGAQIATVAFDMPEESLCSIKSTDSRGCCCSSSCVYCTREYCQCAEYDGGRIAYREKGARFYF